MKTSLLNLRTRACLSLIVVLTGSFLMASPADAQLRGLGGRFNLPSMGGSRSGSANVGRVLQAVGTIQASRSRGRNYSQPVPVVNPRNFSQIVPVTKPRQTCPAPAPMPIVDPTPVPPPPAVAPVPSVEETKMALARSLVERAKRSFAAEDYQGCADTLTEVLKLMPEDADAYQFRSLAYFASQEFDKAAADAYDSFRFGNAWTWATMVTMYPPKQDSRYTEQLRGLEKLNRSEQRNMSTHFLLAYHYIVLNHLPQAERQLNAVLQINAEEGLSKQLLAVVQNAQQADKVTQK